MVPMTTLVARHVLAGNVLAIEPCTSVYRIHAHVYPYRQLLVWATRYLQCSSFVVESKKRVKVVKVDYTGTLAYLGTRCTACIVYVMYHSRYVYAARIPVHVQSFTLCYNGAQNVLYNVSCWPSVKALNLCRSGPRITSPSFSLFPEQVPILCVSSESIYTFFGLFFFLFVCFLLCFS